jgi:hypothetical protein
LTASIGPASTRQETNSMAGSSRDETTLHTAAVELVDQLKMLRGQSSVTA